MRPARKEITHLGEEYFCDDWKLTFFKKRRLKIVSSVSKKKKKKKEAEFGTI